MFSRFNPWFVCLALSACGGGGGGGAPDTVSLTEFVACGGDIIGNWNIESTDMSGLEQGTTLCPEAEISAEGSVMGTLDFQGTSEYRFTVDLSLTLVTEYPPSCLGNAPSCQELLIGDCVGDIEVSCSCTVEIQGSPETAGAWRVDGTSVVLTSANSTEASLPFCVSEDRMELLEQLPNTGFQVLYGTALVTE